MSEHIVSRRSLYDEIERLCAKVVKLRAALEAITKQGRWGDGNSPAVVIARAALEETK